jgi:hypothetical protein
MVFQGTLDFNLLLGWDYVYTMEVVVSTLFRVMHFPHDGSIVTIDQFLFISPDHCMTIDHLNSMNVPHIQVVSTPPQANYVALSPMPSIANEKEPLPICSSSFNLVSTVDMVTPSLWTLELVLPPID